VTIEMRRKYVLNNLWRLSKENAATYLALYEKKDLIQLRLGTANEQPSDLATVREICHKIRNIETEVYGRADAEALQLEVQRIGENKEAIA